MPIYEYECQSCHKVFEYMQRMSEDRKTECEECKGALERIISQSAFHLKGGGWYNDLYSSTKKDGDSKGTGSSSADSTSKSDSAASKTPATSTGESSAASAAPAAPAKANSSGGSD
ncbi:MAG: zinc ribbon domain-containing protein [Myxococcales bacterium]|nr:zinc ribbon domain-containing protein [Myxococcales bacterium]